MVVGTSKLVENASSSSTEQFANKMRDVWTRQLEQLRAAVDSLLDTRIFISLLSTASSRLLQSPTEHSYSTKRIERSAREFMCPRLESAHCSQALYSVSVLVRYFYSTLCTEISSCASGTLGRAAARVRRVERSAVHVVRTAGHTPAAARARRDRLFSFTRIESRASLYV